jgi:hypothetical protein
MVERLALYTKSKNNLVPLLIRGKISILVREFVKQAIDGGLAYYDRTCQVVWKQFLIGLSKEL